MIEPTRDATWYQLAFSRTILVRSLVFALVVGTVLCLINHCDCIVNGKFGAMCLTKSLLTATIPFLVSMTSSVLAVKKSQESV